MRTQRISNAMAAFLRALLMASRGSKKGKGKGKGSVGKKGGTGKSVAKKKELLNFISDAGAGCHIVQYLIQKLFSDGSCVFHWFFHCPLFYLFVLYLLYFSVFIYSVFFFSPFSFLFSFPLLSLFLF